MTRCYPSRLILGVGVLILGGLLAADVSAQPPGKKGRDRKGPDDAEFKTVSGKVKEITTAPKGEVDGLILSDGTWIHWPPHMQDRFSSIAARGDRVRATGYWETGRKGETKLEVSTLTNVDTNKSRDNPDRPAPQAEGRGRGGSVEERLQALEQKVDRLLAEVERQRRQK